MRRSLKEYLELLLFFKVTSGLPKPPVPSNSAWTNVSFASSRFWSWARDHGAVLLGKLVGSFPTLSQARKSRAFSAFRPVPISGLLMPSNRHLNLSKLPFLIITKSQVSPSWTLTILASLLVYVGGDFFDRLIRDLVMSRNCCTLIVKALYILFAGLVQQ